MENSRSPSRAGETVFFFLDLTHSGGSRIAACTLQPQCRPGGPVATVVGSTDGCLSAMLERQLGCVASIASIEPIDREV